MIMEQESVVLTGLGWELPGLEIERLSQAVPANIDATKFDPKIVLGRKGLRYKDHATLLALCAAKRALLAAGVTDIPNACLDCTRFGVVASSNLGNLDTVAAVARTIRTQHVDETSAMDLPNASSNNVAVSIAIRFGLQGINLMVCNGATSSLDALHLAANCIRAGRADRMLVVGVEAATDAAHQFLGEIPLFNGAVAVLLESEASVKANGTMPKARIEDYRLYPEGTLEEVPMEDTYCFCDSTAFAECVPTDLTMVDVKPIAGEAYGTEGMVQLGVAAEYLCGGKTKQALLIAGGRLGDLAVATLSVRGLS